MKTVNILVLWPHHLNLNGDTANAGVLARRLNWYGVSSTIEFLDVDDELPSTRPDFILLGHGSEAAWRSLGAAMEKSWPTISAWLEAGTFGLAVNSGQELLHTDATRLFAGQLEHGDRVSKFAIADGHEFAHESRALGYRNSTSNAPLIERHKNFIGTQLHGPILAKNAWLADWIIAGLVGELQPTTDGQVSLRLAAELEAGIWALEEELAN